MLPPTSWALPDPIVIPGVSAAKASSVLLVGTVSSASRVICFRVVVFCTSTTGLCPETVTVSSSAPMRISALTVAVKLAASSTPSRLNVLKEGSENVTA